MKVVKRRRLRLESTPSLSCRLWGGFPVRHLPSRCRKCDSLPPASAAAAGRMRGDSAEAMEARPQGRMKAAGEALPPSPRLAVPATRGATAERRQPGARRRVPSAGGVPGKRRCRRPSQDERRRSQTASLTGLWRRRSHFPSGCSLAAGIYGVPSRQPVYVIYF